jgi:hypothetical protein
VAAGAGYSPRPIPGPPVVLVSERPENSPDRARSGPGTPGPGAGPGRDRIDRASPGRSGRFAPCGAGALQPLLHPFGRNIRRNSPGEAGCDQRAPLDHYPQNRGNGERKHKNLSPGACGG